MSQPKIDPDAIVHLVALATSLEDEGQYNLAKLIRASAESLLTSAAREQRIPKDKPNLLAEAWRAIETLSSWGVGADMIYAANAGRTALAEGRLPAYKDTPDPYVCRTCGHLDLKEPETCPVCGAHPNTFKRFRPIYWMEALDPFKALEHLRSTPSKVAALIEPVKYSPKSHTQPAEGWSLLQAITHLRDAQRVLAVRVQLLLENENPYLEAKAMFEWVRNEAGEVDLGETFEDYRASREQTVARLESIPLSAWWRSGQHDEFGPQQLHHQASYFACHELAHLPQLRDLVRQAT